MDDIKKKCFSSQRSTVAETMPGITLVTEGAKASVNVEGFIYNAPLDHKPPTKSLYEEAEDFLYDHIISIMMPMEMVHTHREQLKVTIGTRD